MNLKTKTKFMNQNLIHEVFSTLQKGEFIRLAWEDENEKFHKTGTQNYEQFISKVDELKSHPYIASIWFSPNPSNSPSSHTQEDITRAQWVYVDIDDVSSEEFLQKYDYIKPTYTVATGHGVQLYWKLKQSIDMPDDKWQAIENAIERKFHGEKGESQALLRVPNTPNRKHLIKKHKDNKSYTVETKCEVIGSCDEEYALDDFIKAGLDVDYQPDEPVTSSTAKRSLDDLERIRQYCSAINEAFSSIENNQSNEKTVGHYKRLAVASMIRHTIGDEGYLLKLFSNVSDFNGDKTLKHYRSLDKNAITCEKLQKWGLCNGTCQLMDDINRKSPIAFAYRTGVQLKLIDELFKNLEDDKFFDELIKRIKEKANLIKQSKLIDRLQLEGNIGKREIQKALKNIEIIDDEIPYIVDGKVIPVKAAKYMVKEYKLLRYQQDFYRYRDGIWALLEAEKMESLIHHEIGAFSCNHNIYEIKNGIMREGFVSEDKVENSRNMFMIAASNGLLDVKEKKLIKYKPEHYVFKKMNAKYDPKADCPKFKAFLGELFEGDDDADQKIKLVQEIFGYLLIPDYTLVKKMFYFYGYKADNGKSSLLEIIRDVFGPDYFGSIAMDQLDGFLLKKLKGKHANIVGDQNSRTRVPDGIIKLLIGGMDDITADVKHKEAINFTNTARLIFAVNKLPYSEAKDEGYFTRAVILIFNNQFLVNPDLNNSRQMQRNPEKITEIKEKEKDGILNWMLEGLERLIANKKLTIPKSCERALEDYKEVNSTVLLYVKEKCKLSPDSRINRTELYECYRYWCSINGFRSFVNAHTFYETLKREFDITYDKNEKERLLVGIKRVAEPKLAQS